MRIGVTLPVGAGADLASEADAVGVFAVHVPGDGGLGAVRAGALAVATTDARIVVDVELGDVLPVTLAEELTVLDGISAGRIVARVRTGALDLEAAREDLALVRTALSGRPIRHHGERWTIPAGLNDGAPDAIMVTPPAVQAEIPIWLDGDAAVALAAETGLPRIARDPAETLASSGMQPAVARLSGDLDADRALVLAWRDAGATHLLVGLPDPLGAEVLRDYVARHLIPEVAMVDFPRLMAESAPPPSWPGA